ncbi:MAG: hypothetical protein U9N49_12300 [Campylobacterota bacterium]|nr:hypothetical protein [Campylobacterota bacterium]
MIAIGFEVKKADLVDEFMQWLHQHAKEDVKLTFVRDSSAQFDEHGIEYVDEQEQKEIESILEQCSDEDKEVSHTKTLTIEL